MPLITLTTDFGVGSPYVAQMKGVILSLNPAAQVVDISHAIEPQNIRQAAIVMAEVTVHFPVESIHVAVIDPGVGTDREIVCTVIDGQKYIAPDNGILSLLAACKHPSTMIALSERRFWRPEVSATFHGRDIMAPVAAHLSLGVAPEQLGRPMDCLVDIPWPEARTLPNKIEGEIVSVDSFGNLVTNITEEMLSPITARSDVVIRCDEHETQGIFATYGDQPPMTLIALVGSSGKLELAIVDDNAKIMLGVGVGEKVTLSW